MSAINSLREMLEMLDAYLYIWDETLLKRGDMDNVSGRKKWKQFLQTSVENFEMRSHLICMHNNAFVENKTIKPKIILLPDRKI